MRITYFQFLGFASSSAGLMIAIWALIKGSLAPTTVALVSITLELYGVANFLAALCLYRQITQEMGSEAK